MFIYRSICKYSVIQVRTDYKQEASELGQFLQLPSHIPYLGGKTNWNFFKRRLHPTLVFCWVNNFTFKSFLFAQFKCFSRLWTVQLLHAYDRNSFCSSLMTILGSPDPRMTRLHKEDSIFIFAGVLTVM